MKKCTFCNNEISVFESEEIESMTQEEIDSIKAEHAPGCEWAVNLQNYYDNGSQFDGLDDADFFTIEIFKAESIVDILVEKGIIDENDLKKRMVQKANKGIDLEARDRIVKYINENYRNR